jgi:hypothetical protein
MKAVGSESPSALPIFDSGNRVLVRCLHTGQIDRVGKIGNSTLYRQGCHGAPIVQIQVVHEIPQGRTYIGCGPEHETDNTE